VKFFFELLETLPAAEASLGDTARSTADVSKVAALLHDLADADEGALADALRPFYIEYLLEHDA